MLFTLPALPRHCTSFARAAASSSTSCPATTRVPRVQVLHPKAPARSVVQELPRPYKAAQILVRDRVFCDLVAIIPIDKKVPSIIRHRTELYRWDDIAQWGPSAVHAHSGRIHQVAIDCASCNLLGVALGAGVCEQVRGWLRLTVESDNHTVDRRGTRCFTGPRECSVGESNAPPHVEDRVE